MKDVRFRGDGCAISIAAASLLTELILATGAESISDDQLIAALGDIKPARVQCALLPLELFAPRYRSNTSLMKVSGIVPGFRRLRVTIAPSFTFRTAKLTTE